MNDAAPIAMPIETTPEAAEERGLYAWVATLDHKRIGILYLLTALLFFGLGGIEALFMRVQLAVPNNHFLSPHAFNELFTMHGTTMIFLVAMPALIGLANYLVPLMIGARDMAFPRLNAMSFWFLLFGGLLLYFSFAAGGAPSAGWFSYAPLSENAYNAGTGIDYWIISLLLLGVGSVATSINLIVTILTLRAPGLTIRRLPLFVWMTLVNSFLIILALPALNASIVMLLIDRVLGANFFNPVMGGSAILWQHFFWSFGHPEVYIVALPAFGIISEVIPVFSRKPIFGYGYVAASTVAIALLSFGVWAHHMFAAGLGHTADVFFGAASMLIAVPTGVKIFNWIATMWGGSLRFTTSMMYAVAFLIEFVIGGLSGVAFAVFPIDWQMTDTYFVVAHLHYVLIGGTLFALFAGMYYWFPKISGRRMSEKWGKAQFWMTVIGFNMTFFVQHFLGLWGMPRRVYTYPDLPGWGSLNMISTIGAFVMGLGMVMFVWNVCHALVRGEPAGDNPWEAWTLEWATSSPPAPHNFESLPPVHGRRPLWDLAHPGAPDQAVPKRKDSEARPKDKDALAMGAFMLSEGFFFLMLILAYLYYNARSGEAPAAGELDIWKTSLYTVCLIGSSFTFWLGERQLQRGRVSRFLGWLGVTVLLGVIFLTGQGREYAHLIRHGATMHSSLFATTFFTLTGFHGLHVCVGLIALMILFWRVRRGYVTDGHRGPVKSIGLYWHFVDCVWLAVFTVVYIRMVI